MITASSTASAAAAPATSGQLSLVPRNSTGIAPMKTNKQQVKTVIASQSRERGAAAGMGEAVMYAFTNYLIADEAITDAYSIIISTRTVPESTNAKAVR